jgi:hypothetical protein
MNMAYELEGRMLEVCTCKAICPCWVGEDPDGGTCDGVIAWHIDDGTVDGVDVSGLTFAVVAHIPGNVLTPASWRVVAYVDAKAAPQQEEALLNVWTGKLGGPVADLAGLIGEVVAVERAPVTFTVEKGKGRFKLGDSVEAELSPLQGATGATTLNDTAFSSIPGSPAYVGKAPKYKANAPALGLNIDLQDHNAVQGSFRFVA